MAQSNEVVDPSLGESSTAAYAPQEPSSYGSYSSSTDPQNYNYYGYQQQQQQQQQQHGGAYQNSGAPYQPITSFQNTGSYAGSTSYPTTYYNTGDYQTTQLYPGSGYSNQTTSTWQHDPSYPSHQYSNYDSNVAHNSSTAAAPQLSYEQQYKQWADYYSQTTSNVSCAPGTENISATCTSTQNVRVSAVANDYIPLESQPPPPGTTSWRQEPSSSELPSLQAGVVTVPSDTSNGYWRHEALGFQNHHVTQTLSYSDAPAYNQTASYSPAPSYIQTPLSQAPPFTQAPALYQNSLDLNPVQYENSQNLQKTAGPHGSNSQYPTIQQIPQSYHSPMQTVSSFDTSRVNKVQIPTNPRIASNLAMGLPKTDKGSPTTTVATKPAYVSVSMPKSDSNLPSHGATDSMLKPGTFPQSLRAYVERALARCKSDLQKTACQTIMKEIITKASADGTLFTRNWDIEPLFPLPDIDSPNKDSLQNPSIVSSATKYKRSPSRRTKSRWEPMPEEKLVEKLAAVNQLPVKNVSWNHVKEREKTVSGGKFENKGGWSNAKPLHSQQQNQSKPSQKPFKKPRFGDIYKVTENGDASSDSEKEQGLTAYYSGAIALANTPEERKRRESRSKRFYKGPGQHTQIKNIRTKDVGGGNLYTKRASAFSLVLGKGAEDGGSRAVEDIDWDSLTVKGTCQEIEKRYLRLTSAPDPATVRPEEVLEKALLMVLSSPKNYLYKCDQLKSVRQDLTVQRIRNELTVRVYETHARLALEAGDLPEYNQCQSQLKILYAEGIKGCDMEFSAYNLLCVILHSNNTRDLVSSMARLSVEAKRDEAVKHALAVRAAVTSGNYVLFFRLYKTAPNLNTCLMDLYVEKMRYEAVKCMSRSYRPSVPLAFVAQVLGFLSSLPETEKKDDQTDALEECEEWLRAHGACLIGDNNGEMQLDTKASSSSLFMPEPEDAVSHGDANLAVNDFLTRSA